MPIVLFTFALGIFIGYWLCRMQLRGKFLLADEQMPLPPPWRAPEPLPTLTPPTDAPAPALTVKSENTPHGYSAKQVLGYNDWGRIHHPQYPGGIQQWDVDVNGITRTEEDE